MISIREQILAALASTAVFDTGVGQDFEGVNVERNRDNDVQDYDALIIVDGPQSVVGNDSGVTIYSMAVAIEGYTQATSGALAGAAINALYAKTVTAINADITLGNLATDVTEVACDFDIDRSTGKSVGSFDMALQIEYQTREGDPYTLGP